MATIGKVGIQKFVNLKDVPKVITPLQYLQGKADGTALEFGVVDNAERLGGVLPAGYATFDKQFYIGTTQVAINRGSGTLTLAGIILSTPGTNNTAFGVNALYSNTDGYGNTANGVNALYSNTTGSYNTAIGYLALYFNTTGNYNTASGAYSLYFNTTGYYNTASGKSALYSNTTGNYNTASGVNALYYNTTGYENTASGMYALHSNTTGYENTANGYNAGRSLTTGSNNTFLGYSAGYHTSQLISATNSMALGNGAYTTADNQVVIGNTAITQTLLRGNVGIRSISVGVSIKTTAYTMTTADCVILADATSGAFTITLPSASNTGMLIKIKKVDASVNVITIASVGTDTIDGETTVPLGIQWQQITLIASGGNLWAMFAQN